ncbi:GNAT family N-acetyltransferase [Micromonospora sp. NBC_01813]|uniref:GNAT family N-acetyltransferase n=1 Tax=Micromonospora sp. NBC_01813 TaxID=2975988 RepID=UPI002DD87697|nr:GNAT family N-acetyltransferase [Micromonospora sp. NBC_01813]WSA09280.1 GNAT family N-acetyltransferase [Micromonospora sp. NBC_01813]
MLIERRPSTDPEVAALVATQQRELAEAQRVGRPVDPVAYPLHDDARYLVCVVSGRAVGCGAIRSLDGRTAEITRMYVRPAYRGRGIARHLLTALEESAYALGHTVFRLETGSYLPAALHLYATAGYAQIPVYGEYVGNPYSVCFEKQVPVVAA